MFSRLALAAAVLAATLGLLEVAVRLLGYEGASRTYSEPSLFWRYDPLLGWSHEPNASATFVGPRPYPIEFRTPVSINSQGLRGPEIPPLPEGGFRALILGDSLVAAFEVTWEETFVALAEKRLARELERPVQLINAGVRGYGTDQALLYFRERGRQFQPQLVVYMESLNDASDNMTLHRMRRPFGKPVFRMLADGSLASELEGHPVPEYPMCSSFGLDASFAPRRFDGPAQRGLCWFETRFADHSAFFTFALLRIGRTPWLMRMIYDVVKPKELAAAKSPAAHEAGVLPLQIGADIPSADTRAASYRLTSALVRQLAKEVRASGADFMWIVTRDELSLMDQAALARDHVEPSFWEIRGDAEFQRSFYFKNDFHLTPAGHFMVAPLFARQIRERVPKQEPAPGQ
jgi:lysophospholipase L1-like esterase